MRSAKKNHAQPVALAEFLKLRHARHGPVVVHDLADHAAGPQSGQPRQIDYRFGLPGANQHAALARAQRKNMTGASQVSGRALRVDGDLNGAGTIGC